MARAQLVAGAGGLDTFLHRAAVYARMSPDDKRLLMELLGEGALGEDGREIPGLGHHVGFCGARAALRGAGWWRGGGGGGWLGLAGGGGGSLSGRPALPPTPPAAPAHPSPR